jgi:hypothetical protein
MASCTITMRRLVDEFIWLHVYNQRPRLVSSTYIYIYISSYLSEDHALGHPVERYQKILGVISFSYKTSLLFFRPIRCIFAYPLFLLANRGGGLVQPLCYLNKMIQTASDKSKGMLSKKKKKKKKKKIDRFFLMMTPSNL